MILKIKKLTASAKTPTRATENAAGWDLYPLEEIVCTGGPAVKIRTGLAIEIPLGYAGILKDRSGNASKGLHVLGGVIDSDYRGEIVVLATILHPRNWWPDSRKAIAQLLIVPYLHAQLELVQELSPTERDKRGFGSSDFNQESPRQ